MIESVAFHFSPDSAMLPPQTVMMPVANRPWNKPHETAMNRARPCDRLPKASSHRRSKSSGSQRRKADKANMFHTHPRIVNTAIMPVRLSGHLARKSRQAG
jgi:hypothetical protein